MENYNIGINSAWYAESLKLLKRENKLNDREDYICFYQKKHAFRIDEIWIHPETQEKIFVEHYKDEFPRIYRKEQHGNYFKLQCISPYMTVYFDKKYDTIQEAIKDAKSLIQGINKADLYVIQNRNKKAKISNVHGDIKMQIL